MKRIWIFLVVVVLLAAVGCEKKDEQAADAAEIETLTAMAACPVCGQEMRQDAYCAGCNAVATTETDWVNCRECDQDFKPGTYCAECNRFMLNATIKCGICQSQVVKGHYCPHEKQFKGLPDIAYCEKHRRPHQRDGACPYCEQEKAQAAGGEL